MRRGSKNLPSCPHNINKNFNKAQFLYLWKNSGSLCQRLRYHKRNWQFRGFIKKCKTVLKYVVSCYIWKLVWYRYRQITKCEVRKRERDHWITNWMLHATTIVDIQNFKVLFCKEMRKPGRMHPSHSRKIQNAVISFNQVCKRLRMSFHHSDESKTLWINRFFLVKHKPGRLEIFLSFCVWARVTFLAFKAIIFITCFDNKNVLNINIWMTELESNTCEEIASWKSNSTARH